METKSSSGFVENQSSDYKSVSQEWNGLFGQHGWICPKCGRVYSPFTMMCPYCKGINSGDITAQGLKVE